MLSILCHFHGLLFAPATLDFTPTSTSANGRPRKEVFVVIVVDECFGDLGPIQRRHFRGGRLRGLKHFVKIEANVAGVFLATAVGHPVPAVTHPLRLRPHESGHARLGSFALEPPNPRTRAAIMSDPIEPGGELPL